MPPDTDADPDVPPDTDADPDVPPDTDADADPGADATIDVMPDIGDDAGEDTTPAEDVGGSDAADAADSGASDVGDTGGVDVDPGTLVDWTVEVELLARGDATGVEATVTVDPDGDVRSVTGAYDEPAVFVGIEAGPHHLMVEAVGFETWSERVLVDVGQVTRVRLLPDGPVSVSGVVTASTGVAPATGSVTFTGLEARAGVLPVTVELDPSGAFEADELAAGFYRLDVAVARGDGIAESLTIERFDALADGHVALQTTPVVAVPDIEELSGCATVRRVPSELAGSLALAFLGLFGATRRRK